MSGIFSILSDGQAGLFRLQQARRAAAGGGQASGSSSENGGAPSKTGSPSSIKDGTRHLSDLLAKGSPDSLTDFMRGASAALSAMEQAQKVNLPKARAEERLQEAERRIKELRTEMRMAAARGDRDKVMKLAREAASLAKQVGNAAKDYGRGIAASADMGLGGGAGLSLQTQTTASVSVTTVQVSQTTATVTLTAGTEGAEGAAPTAEAPPPVPVEVPPPAPVVPAADADARTPAEAARQRAEQDEDGGGLAAAINAALSAIGGGGDGTGGTGQGTTPANPFQAQMDGNAQRTARFREADTFARRVETVLAAIKNVLGEAKASNLYDPDQTRRKGHREELKDYDKVVAEADKAVNELRSAAYGTPGADAAAGGSAAAVAGAAATAVPVTAGSVNLVT